MGFIGVAVLASIGAATVVSGVGILIAAAQVVISGLLFFI